MSAAFCRTCIHFYALLFRAWICIVFACWEDDLFPKKTYFQRSLPIPNNNFFYFVFYSKVFLKLEEKPSLVLHWSTWCTHTKQYFHKFLGKSAGIFKRSTTAYSGTCVNEIFTCIKLSLHSMIDPQEGLSKVKAPNWNTAHLTAFSFELQKIHIKNENLKWQKAWGSHMSTNALRKMHRWESLAKWSKKKPWAELTPYK